MLPPTIAESTVILKVQTFTDLAFNALDISKPFAVVMDEKELYAYDVPSSAWQPVGISVEDIQDIVAAMLTNTASSTWTYDDATGKLSLTAIGISTEELQDQIFAALAAGTNLTINYNDAGNLITLNSATRTDEEIQDVVFALLAQGANLTLVYNGPANSLTISASGGASIPAGDLNTTTNKLEKINGRALSIPANAALEDNFDDNVLNPLVWEVIAGNAATISETNNRLEISHPTGSAVTNGIKSLNRYDATDKTVQLDIISLCLGHSSENMLEIWQEGSNSFFIYYGGAGSPTLLCRATVNGVTQQIGIPYDSNITKWRITHVAANNTAQFATFSSSTNTWTTHLTATNVFVPNNVQVKISSGYYSNNGTGTVQKFIVDNLVTSLGISLATNSGLFWNGVTQAFETKTPTQQAGFLQALINKNVVPVAANSAGIAGQFASDANYLYVCYALNSWKRIPLTAF